jgi:pyruvate dehydrogenase E1 component alpha subunit
MSMPDALELEAFKLMRLSRAVDRMAVGLQRQGVFGTFGEARGQEATLAGAAVALDPSRDWIVPQYRELPALVRHGVPLELLFLMYTYDPRGFAVPPGVNALCNQVSIAAQLPHAVGLAWGLRLRATGGVVLAFVGDGGSSQGDFFESCNLAGVVKAPVVFLVQNNNWAISTPFAKQTAARSVADRAAGFGIPGVSVDGNDLEAVYTAVSAAVAHAREGGGPSLIEARTYRLGAHNTNDDPSLYRDSEQHAAREAADPLPVVERVLRERGLWSDDDQSADDAQINERLDRALAWAQQHPEPTVDQVFDHVYADPPDRLVRQRAQWHAEIGGAS